MKKNLLFAILCVLGLFGTLNAQVVTIDGTVGGYEASTSNQVPVYNNYEYAITQQYYTAAEIGKSSGTIESIAFKTTETGTYPFTRTLTIYMVNTSEDNFGIGGKTTKAMADTDVVFEGEVTFAQADAWTTIELTTNFEYTGENVLVCVNDATGSFISNSNGLGGSSYFSTFDCIYEFPIDGNPNDLGKAYRVLHKKRSNGAYNATTANSSCTQTKTVPFVQFTFTSSGDVTPTAPTLNSPKNGDTDIFNPSLDFTLGNSTTHYKILRAEASGTNSGEYSILQDWTKKTDNAVSYQTSHLKQNTTYYWKVIARNGEGDNALTTESSVYIFTTKQFSAPGAIEYAYPDGHQDLVNPKFTWEFGADTEEYQVLIDGVVVKDWTNPGSATTGEYQTSGLSSGEHTWQVNVRNSAGTTEGTVYTFSVQSLPDNVTPISPADGATGVTSNIVTFKFAPNTTHYKLMMSDTNKDEMFYFSTNQGGTGDKWTSTNGIEEMSFAMPFFAAGKTFYWTVEVQNAVGERTINGTEKATIYSFIANETLPVTNTDPTNGAANLDNNPTLKWKYNGKATHYQVYLGIGANNLEAQGWIERATEATGLVPNGSFQTSNLNLTANTTYYWRVDVKDANGNVYEGATWSFLSHLPAPGVPTVSQTENPTTEIDPTSETTIAWNALEGVQGYNVYLGTEKLNAEILSAEETSYTIAANTLQHNMDPGYDIYVEAVYTSGEETTTKRSEAINVTVTGVGYLSVTVKDVTTPTEKNVAGATITLTQIKDEWENTEDLNVSYTFTTDENGQYLSSKEGNERPLIGTYKISVEKENYTQKLAEDESDEIVITYNETTTKKLTLVLNIPDNVTPVTPEDEAEGVTDHTIVWDFAEGTDEYRFYFGKSFAGLERLCDWTAVGENNRMEFKLSGLEANTTYYWAVDVKNNLGARQAFDDNAADVAVYSFTTNETLPVTNTDPTNGKANLTDPTLTWDYNGNATHYQVYFGTDANDLEAQGWSERAPKEEGTGLVSTGSFLTADLNERTTYYWRVDVKDANEDVYEGETWSFVSTLPAPVATANQTQIVPSASMTYGETTIAWNALEGVQGYNVYLGTEKLNAEILSAEVTEYTIEAITEKLQYNMNTGYDIYVEAVYELGTSMSEAVNVKVTGTGLLNAKIVKSFNTYLGVDSATITLTQLEDEFRNVYEGNGKQYTFTTNAEGKCNESVLNGIYKVEVSRKYYDTKTIDNVVFKQGETTNLSDSDVIPYVILKADPAYVFEVSIDDISFNSIHIYLENSEWETAPAGHYIVYLKNGDNIEKILTPNQDNPNPWFSSFGVESIRFKYYGWENLSKGSYQFGVAKAEDQINWSATVERNYAVFVKDGNWSDKNNWTYNTLPGVNDEIHVRAAATIAEDEAITAGEIYIESDGSLTINGSLTAEAIYNNATANAVCLNDGGQLRQGNAKLSGVFNMNIATPTNWNNTTNKDGWQFIASPFTDAKVEAWTTGNYDFYKYDGTQQLEWINEKDGINEDFEKVFVQGRGYLASRESESKTITLSGEFNNATSYTWEGLTYNEANDPNDPSSQNLANFYLLGNPFTFNMDMTKASYNNLIEGVAIVNAEGGYTYVGVNQDTTTIPVGDGFFVKVKEPQNATDVISLSYPARSSREKSSSINLVATSKAGQDNVVINFDGQAEGFDKLQNFNDEIATVCVVENDKAYGIYNCDSDVNEIEVTFVAKQMDSYSLSFDIKGEFETVTLVDRMTGVETDMIEESEYSFIATSKDMKNRFVVRFDNGQRTTDNSQFVYQSGEELILSIEGSVQIVDMMGRVVYSAEHSNGSNRISVSEFNNAAYVVRVVNGNGVKTQKVVIY